MIRLVGEVEETAHRRTELFFEYPEDFAHFVLDSGDPFVPALLVACLTSGEDLEIVPPVSPRLIQHLHTVQDILLAWYPELNRVRLTSDNPGQGPTRPGLAVGALFSGGVDSFYTLLKSLNGWRAGTPTATHVVFMKGIGTRFERMDYAEEARRHVAEIAREVGLPLIAGTTNLRSHFDHVNYAAYYHGAVLGTIGLSLSQGLRSVLVPSTFSYAELKPWGSHPLLDPLWSTEWLEVVHDGAEVPRVQKLASMVECAPNLLRYLRVCIDNFGGPGNCGRCRKCVRTALMLKLMGVRSDIGVFPPVSPGEVIAALESDTPEFFEELRALATRSTEQPRLTKLVERVARRQRRRRALRTLLENTPLVDAIVAWLLRIRNRYRALSSLEAETRSRPPFRTGQATATLAWAILLSRSEVSPRRGPTGR